MNTKNSSLRTLSVLGLTLGLAACGMPTTPSDIKFAGVGLDPDEIGAAPTQSGGLIEYVWVEFAGGQMSLAALGLLSFDEAGPGMVGFKPPYGIVNGTGFVFDTNLPGPDSLFGSFAAAPDVVGSCHTVYEPQSYLSNVADVGNGIKFETEDGSSIFTINRRPYVMPPVVQNVFPYYSELTSWRATPWTRKVPTGDGNTLSDVADEVLARPNFPFGQEMTVSFPGGLPPEDATYNSIPVPLAAAGGDTTVTLPAQPQGFMMEWTGPRFDAATKAWYGDGETHSTCLQFSGGETDPSGPADCGVLPDPPTDGNLIGQIYTAPWTTDGGLTLKWAPDSETTDTVSVSIRFLGQVDETERYFVNDAVFVDAPSTGDDEYDEIRDQWEDYIDDGLIPDGTPIPEGHRRSLACDDAEDVNWVFDPALKQSDGGYVPTLQGDPLHTLVEVTCNLDPSAGEFTITNDVLSNALSFADQYQAAGAVFYVARTQTHLIQTPPVRDWVGQKREIEPVTVVTKAVQVGRFWYDR